MQIDAYSDTRSSVPVEGLLWVIGDISTADGVETLYITTDTVLISIPRDLQFEILPSRFQVVTCVCLRNGMPQNKANGSRPIM
jgi:hypothetical protein